MQVLHSDIQEIVNELGVLNHNFEGKKIMIPGGRGFLGKYFCNYFDYLNREILNKKCEVLVLDNYISSEEEFVSYNNIKIKKSDITNDLFKNDIENFSPDYFIFLAGIASPATYKKYPLKTIEIVTKGLVNSLEVCKDNKTKFLWFGSSEVYGNPESSAIPTDETYCGRVPYVGDRSCYDESKRLGCTLAKIYHEQYGTQVMTIHPFNFYGCSFLENDFRVLPNFFSQLLKNKPLQVYGTGNQTRTFCYVTDGIIGSIKALLKGQAGEIYNIGNPNPEISMLDLAKLIKSEIVTDREVNIEIIEYPDTYPSIEPLRRCPSIKKAQTELNYSPKVNLIDGLKRFYNWTKENYNQ